MKQKQLTYEEYAPIIKKMIDEDKFEWTMWQGIPYLGCDANCLSCPLDVVEACTEARLEYLKINYPELTL